MARTTPWYPHPPIWEALTGKRAKAAREHYEERAAIIEEGNDGFDRIRAELWAYAFTVDRIAKYGAAPQMFPDVARQMDRARRILHHETVELKP